MIRSRKVVVVGLVGLHRSVRDPCGMLSVVVLPLARMQVPPRTTGYLFNFPATLFLVVLHTGSTWLRHGVQFCQYQAYVLRMVYDEGE
jgi:hypothetical protein